MNHNKVVFLDTNVVLDILDPKRPNHAKVIELWNLLVVKKYTIMISEDMLSTIFYVNKDKKRTLDFFKMITKRWQIVSFGKDIIKNAIELSLEKSLDLEDTLQCLCAKENGCKVFVTNDKKFYDCGISLYTTQEFLKEIDVQR